MAQRTEHRDHSALGRATTDRTEHDAAPATRALTLGAFLVAGLGAFASPNEPARAQAGQVSEADPEAFLLAIEAEIDAGGALAVEQVLPAQRAIEELKAAAQAPWRMQELLNLQLRIFATYPYEADRLALLSHTHQQRAMHYQGQGRIADACEELEAALEMTVGLTDQAMLNARLADLFRHEGAWSDASNAIALGEQLLVRAGGERGIQSTRASLATTACLVEQELGRLDLAWHHYQRAREASHAHLRELASAIPEVDFEDSLGETFAQTALELLNDPAASAQVRSFAYSALRTRIRLRVLSVGIDLASGFDEASIQTATALLEDPAASPRDRAFASYVRGAALRALTNRGDVPSGPGDFEQDLARALEGELSLDQRALALLWLADADLRQADAGRARTRLQELDEFDADSQALPLTVRGLRAAVEARIAQSAGAEKELLEVHRERLVAIQQELLESWEAAHRPGGVGFLHNAVRRNPLGELVRLERSIGSSETPDAAALGHVLETQSRGSVTRALELGSPSVSMLQEGLEPGTLALVYLFAPTQSYVFGVDSEAVVAHPLASSWELAVLISDFSLRFAWPPPPSPEARRQHARAIEKNAQQLADELLPTALRARIEKAQRLVVVGADQLEVLPFECLRVGERWLGTWKAIEHWPSVAVGLELAERRKTRPGPRGRHILYAQPATPPGELAELRQLDANLQGLRAAWPELEIRRDQQATETSLRDLGGAPVDALMFVVHGRFDEGRALPAALALTPSRADDGNLWCDEVATMTSAPALAVLAACETGRGHQRRGEDGATQMAGAWFQAGSRAVIQSPFLIEEGAAYTLIEELGRGLESGVAVGEALLRARRAVAREHEHPFYFGLVRLVGDGG